MIVQITKKEEQFLWLDNAAPPRYTFLKERDAV